MWSSLVVAGTVAYAAVAMPSPAQNTRTRPATRSAPRPAVAVYLNSSDSTRAALGLGTSSGTSRRDTLGVLITSIVSGSPAEKAGLEEGDRIAAINGVSLQLAPADTGDREMAGLMGRRLQREMQKVKPGETVHLRVYANGQLKTVDVKVASEADVYAESPSFFFRDGDRFGAVPPAPPVPPMAPMPPMPAMPSRAERERMDVLRERQNEATARAMLRAQENMRDAQRRMRDMQFNFDNRFRASWAPSAGRVTVNREDDVINATASGPSYVLRLGGLQLAPVNGDLASYFGAGSADGLLVLHADSTTDLHSGDVILKVNGRSVRSDDEAHLSLNTRQDNSLEVLRKGKRETVTMKARDR